jgi:hypothetical protein
MGLGSAEPAPPPEPELPPEAESGPNMAADCTACFFWRVHNTYLRDHDTQRNAHGKQLEATRSATQCHTVPQSCHAVPRNGTQCHAMPRNAAFTHKMQTPMMKPGTAMAVMRVALLVIASSDLSTGGDAPGEYDCPTSKEPVAVTPDNASADWPGSVTPAQQRTRGLCGRCGQHQSILESTRTAREPIGTETQCNGACAWRRALFCSTDLRTCTRAYPTHYLGWVHTHTTIHPFTCGLQRLDELPDKVGTLRRGHHVHPVLLVVRRDVKQQRHAPAAEGAVVHVHLLPSLFQNTM